MTTRNRNANTGSSASATLPDNAASPEIDEDDFEDPPPHFAAALNRGLEAAAAHPGVKLLRELDTQDTTKLVEGLDELTMSSIAQAIKDEQYARSPKGRAEALARKVRNKTLDKTMREIRKVSQLLEAAEGAIKGTAAAGDISLGWATGASGWRKGTTTVEIKTNERRNSPFRGKFVIVGELDSYYGASAAVSFHAPWGRRHHVARLTNLDDLEKFAKNVTSWAQARRYTWYH